MSWLLFGVRSRLTLDGRFSVEGPLPLSVTAYLYLVLYLTIISQLQRDMGSIPQLSTFARHPKL